MAANIRFHGRRSRRILALFILSAALAMSGHGLAQRDVPQDLAGSNADEGRNFDARIAPQGFAESMAGETQRSEIDALRAEIPELAATFDPATGATRTLWNRVGYLTDPDPRPAREIADSYVAASLGRLGLQADDVADREVTDVVYSRVSGATHIYYRQRINGIPVYNAQLQVNVNREGRILSVNNAFLPDIAASYNALQPALDAAGAVRQAAEHLKVENAAVRAVGSAGSGPRRDTEIAAEQLSAEPVKAALMLLPIRKGEARLVWNFQVHTLDSEHAYDFTVDAESGQVWTRFDWVVSDQYKVYGQPVESPIHTTPAAPDDGRTTAVNPANLTASPFGWHDTNGTAGAEYTIMRGNNVHAYDDIVNLNAPPAAQPDCSSALDCTFAVDLTQAPSAYTAAAITNLFYWNNVLHDVQYQYGFDEAAGNFQVNNYGRGGLANDDVRAEAQDGGGTNNANMLVPPDGQRGRMQMYLWANTSPRRDGDFDNGIIVHEYGHGISIRLVGGPSNSSCLNNPQQPGEGLSDWWALAYTARAGDTGPLRRGVGTYALGQPATGNGIRGVPYTTDTTINTWTYSSIAGRSIPHGVGAVWAQGMWRVYWALVNQHGFDANIYNAGGGAGNQRAMLYVNEGLKNTVCSPTFTDVRDGIIQAAVDEYGGADVCRLWEAFAAFGLGSDAVSGGSGSTTPTNGFNKPIACGGSPLPSMFIDDVTLSEGQSGTTTANFTVALNHSAATEVRVTFATSDGTATSGTTVTSAGSIAIPAAGSGSVSGSPANPYPSAVTVSGIAGAIQRLRVRLNSVSHTYLSDLDIVLVGPGGQRVMLMSDVGTGVNVNNVHLTFEDGAPAMTAAITTGTYAPTDIFPAETLPSPAPAAPYPISLSQFNGTNPNGTWSLYISDDEEFDIGSIGSWSLLVTTAADDYVSTAGQLIFPPGTSTQTISVNINGDTLVESNDTFFVNLSNPQGATIADVQGVGTIANDDTPSMPPGAATLVSPLRRMGFKPTYQWDAVGTSTWYHLWVNDRMGNSIAKWYTAAQVDCASGAGLCSITPDVTLNVGSVDWWVQTWNPAGFGPWSAKASFYVGPERFIVGLGRGGAGEFQPWSSAPTDAAPQASDPSPGVVRQATLELPWPAYNQANGELHPAVGDLDGDGLDEIVMGLGAGSEGWIAVFDDASHGFALLKWIQLPWASYNAGNGTIWPAVGDIDGDGRAEIVAGLGDGGQGFFAVFDDAAQGYAFKTWGRVSWSGYNTGLSGETHPAVVNIDGGAKSEIIIGLGPGGAGWLEVIDSVAGGLAHRRWLRVGWSVYSDGPGETYPAGGDVDGDGLGEIVVGLGRNSQGWIEVIDDAAAGLVHKDWLRVGWAPYASGVGETHPAVGNIDADASMEIVLGLAQYVTQGGWFEVRDDSGAGYVSIGWGNVGQPDFRAAGGATYPAAGRLR